MLLIILTIHNICIYGKVILRARFINEHTLHGLSNVRTFDGLLQVNEGSTYGHSEAVESFHLLNQYSVHALLVAYWVLDLCFLKVKARGDLQGGQYS